MKYIQIAIILLNLPSCKQQMSFNNYFTVLLYGSVNMNLIVSVYNTLSIENNTKFARIATLKQIDHLIFPYRLMLYKLFFTVPDYSLTYHSKDMKYITLYGEQFQTFQNTE